MLTSSQPPAEFYITDYRLLKQAVQQVHCPHITHLFLFTQMLNPGLAVFDAFSDESSSSSDAPCPGVANLEV